MLRLALVALCVVASAFAVGCRSQANDGASSDASVDAPAAASTATLLPTKDTAARMAGRDAGADAGVDPVAQLARGTLLYGRYCNFCHGEAGVGYAADQAPKLASDDLLAFASDDFLRDAIVKGRPGTTMSAWSVARGGPLGYDDASAIVALVRTWQKGPSVPTDARKVDGDAERGAPLFATHCASCHGAKGRDGKHNALANAELLASATDGFLAATIERGRAGTPMASFAGKLTSAQIDDVVALLRSWQKAPEEAPELPPKPGALTNVVINPRGPQAKLDAKADFIKADLVKAEVVDRHASMIIVDARPPSDYARMHIAGAISVPFYQVEAFSKEIPKDRYILTYCGCPHAESVKVRDALRRLGYPRVAVIDEGILVWRDRGYPVRGGAKP
jgi:cytochrome c oxidase cbb3-type subunit 3/ubiquinol-cytochrome c reductase cytochrome c subunit